MKKLEFKSWEEERVCHECGKDYMANIASFGDLSGGRCRECRDKQIRAIQDAEETTKQMAIAHKRLSWRSESGIPPLFLNKEFGSFELDRPGNIRKVHGKCLAYAEGFPLNYFERRRSTGKAYPSLLMYSDGVWGVGKSMLSCSIAHNIYNRWNGEEISNPVVYENEPDLLRRIRGTYSFSNDDRRVRESEDDIISRLASKPLLILDDVGKEEPRDPKFVRRILYEIINSRYNNLLPMVVTTNLKPEQLKGYVGTEDNQATYDRLFEMCDGAFYKLTGKSYRRKVEGK